MKNIKKLIKVLDLSKFHEFRDFTIINLIFDTGMRLNETLNLTIHDIELIRRTIVIPAHITKSKKDKVAYFIVCICLNCDKDGLDSKIQCKKVNYYFQLKGLTGFYQYLILKETSGFT